jgi:hypothetical protein
MLSREFTSEGHITRVTVTRNEGGWKLVEECDRQLVRDVQYTDWHRVERAMQSFELAGHHYSTNR